MISVRQTPPEVMGAPFTQTVYEHPHTPLWVTPGDLAERQETQ